MLQTTIEDTTMDLKAIQSALRENKLDGWLFYDHHNRDPLAYRILGIPGGHVTRRWYYFIPADSSAEPKKLVHRIESHKLDLLPGSKDQYSSWNELEAKLRSMLEGATKIAMQYSPNNAIMYVSLVDAGTVELLRSFGKEIVTSADLVSHFEAVLTDAQIATHYEAQRKLDAILEAGWREISSRVGARGTDEYSMVEFLQNAIEREGMVTEYGPNVSAGPNSADSHYQPTAATSKPIRSGDFLLIDIWSKLANDPQAVWYDITWTAVIGRAPTDREQHIFTTVRDARDAAIARVQQAFASNIPIAGYEADDASRAVIRDAGLADWFTHRTGHNIATELHGNGAHLDNLETHDTRLILPNTCFSVEPGLYFPSAYSGDSDAFGVRSEVNLITRPGRAEVTGRIQTELLRL